jgi:hypothetical protein
MSAQIIPFRVPTADTATDLPMTTTEVHAAIQKLEAVDHDLQIQAHAVNLAIGEARRQRLALVRLLDAFRSA